MMNRMSATAALALVFLSVVGCSLVGRLTGADKITRTSEMWSDVPKMTELSQSDVDLPWGTKLLMRTALNNLWRLNKEGEDDTPVEGDWAVFSGAATPSDVETFYSNERMASYGRWDPSKESTCIGGKEHGVDNGVICVYKKTENGKEILLAILAGQGKSKKETNVFYMRLEKAADKVKTKK